MTTRSATTACANNSAAIHPYRASVTPKLHGKKRPLWSVMIPTYNCANYLGECLTSVLMQAPSSEKMQIEVIDDCSTDTDVAQFVQDLCGNRVGFYRHPKQVGHIKNFHTCLQRSRGFIIHLLHGDDYVRNGFYDKMERAFNQKQPVGAAFCRTIYIDEHGVECGKTPIEQPSTGIFENALDLMAKEQRVMTPSMVVDRQVYERLGSFDSRLQCSEDWEMWVRIAAHYPIWYETEPLAAYRIHTQSNTGRHIKNADDVRFNQMAINIFSKYLPANIAAKSIGLAKQTYALSALKTAEQMFAVGEFQAGRHQFVAALRCSLSRKVLVHAYRLLKRRTFLAIAKKKSATPH